MPIEDTEATGEEQELPMSGAAVGEIFARAKSFIKILNDRNDDDDRVAGRREDYKQHISQSDKLRQTDKNTHKWDEDSRLFKVIGTILRVEDGVQLQHKLACQMEPDSDVEDIPTAGNRTNLTSPSPTRDSSTVSLRDPIFTRGIHKKGEPGSHGRWEVASSHIRIYLGYGDSNTGAADETIVSGVSGWWPGELDAVARVVATTILGDAVIRRSGSERSGVRRISGTTDAHSVMKALARSWPTKGINI